jgi:intracellular sulfur oxidation DsrE/DsrF family protein
MPLTHLRFVALFLASAPFLLLTDLPSAAQTSADAPYGSANFRAYPDIAELRQLKVVWDFNFSDPKAASLGLNFVGALMQATAEFGPHEIDATQIVIVSHGPEAVVFAKQNYGKYKEIVDRAASFAKQGVRFEVCGRASASQGFEPQDLHGFVTAVPAAPYALAYWQAKGFTLNAVGATMPSGPVNDLNRADLKPRSR